MKRRELSTRARTTVAQKLPVTYKERLATFLSHCRKKIADKHIRPKHITNIDELPLIFDIPVNGLVEKIETGRVAIRTTFTVCTWLPW